jgi:hypothetical protein
MEDEISWAYIWHEGDKICVQTVVENPDEKLPHSRPGHK